MSIIVGVILVNALCTALVATLFRLHNKGLKKRGESTSDPEMFLFFAIVCGPLGLVITAVAGIAMFVANSSIRKRLYKRVHDYAEASNISKEYQPSRLELQSKIFEQGQEIEHLRRQLAEYVLIHGDVKDVVS